VKVGQTYHSMRTGVDRLVATLYHSVIGSLMVRLSLLVYLQGISELRRSALVAAKGRPLFLVVSRRSHFCDEHI
jgi:hypothetical protein